MNTPLLSVIMPAYNTELYIQEALESLLNQSLKSIEIIVADDGSSDSTVSIVKQLKDNDCRIKLYVMPENQGQSMARNMALRYARGKYVYFMDSDDWLMHPDALEIAVERCEQTNLEFLFFDADIFYMDRNASPLAWNYQRTARYDEQTVWKGLELMKDMLVYGTWRAAPWLMIVRRELLQNNNMEFYPSIIHEDELFMAKLMPVVQRAGCLKRSLVGHRVHTSSTMGRHFSIRNMACYLTVVDELKKYEDHIPAASNQVLELYIRYTLNPVIRTASVLSFKEKIEILKMICKRGYIKYLTVCSLVRFMI